MVNKLLCCLCNQETDNKGCYYHTGIDNIIRTFYMCNKCGNGR